MDRSWLIVPDFNRLEESVALAREYGAAFEYDDFYAPAVYEDADEVERRVAAYLALERDRSADTLHGVFFDIKPNSLDSAIRDRSRALMRQSLAIANRLGVRGVVFHSDIYGGMRLSIPPEVWLDSAEGLFRQLCAENRDLSIYLENTIEQEPDQLVALAQRMADVPNFALALDYAHASLSATDGGRWLREMGPFVRHVHLNDNDLYADRHWPVGQGSIDYPRFAALADAHIPGVPMLMEVRTLEDARASLQAMEALQPQPAAPDAVADAPGDAALDTRLVEEVLESGLELTRQKDKTRLLDTILTRSMRIANCDGGTLYTLKDGQLCFTIMKTISMGVDRGGDGAPIDIPPVPMVSTNVSAWAALNGRSVAIDDVYAEHAAFDFSGPKRFDEQSGYRTRSMLAVPLMDSDGGVLGVMQLINAQDESGALCSFSLQTQRLIQALAAQAAVIMRQMAYLDEMRTQMWSFTSAMATAIDQRTPYNGSHTRKVAHFAKLIAQQLNAGEETAGEERFSAQRTDQLVMAALLHDIGKMVIPTAVMDKPTRLGAELPAVLARIELLEDRQRLAFYEGRLGEGELAEALQALAATCELVLEADGAGFVTQETADALRAAARRTYWSHDELQPCLTPQQVEKLCITKGTLTPQERTVMEGHVEMTRRILAEVHFNEDFAQAPVFATQHHEFLDGSGYPLGLRAEQLPLESRILAVADIADALMADDRPYKKAMPAERAFGILHSMAAEGKLEERLVTLLEEALAEEEEPVSRP